MFLPLIMLEMDSSSGQNAASLLGAIECTLAMVSVLAYVLAI